MNTATTQSTEVDFLLRQFDHTRFSSYYEFMRAFILETLSTSDKSFDTLNYELQTVNRAIYERLCTTALSYYDTYATDKTKSLED